jgi:hypothetical protein
MLKYLKLENVGPAAKMELDLAPRLNIITGDNGLGKSFLLDVAWFVHVGLWPSQVNPKLQIGLPAIPREEGQATIEYADSASEPEFERPEKVSYHGFDLKWFFSEVNVSRNKTLVVYLMADNSFALFDPLRKHPVNDNQIVVNRRSLVLDPSQVWNGLLDDDGKWQCNGLIRDWATWQGESSAPFASLTKVLELLSPSESELLEPGSLTRISIDDSRRMPTIKMPYEGEIPLIHTSAAMRRILAFAYLVVWAWEEHQSLAKLRRTDAAENIIILFDEVEAHLHPSWQRKIVPALLEAVRELSKDLNVQLIATTHSPLVMASLEPHFDAEKDAWFDLDLVRNNGSKPAVVLTKRTFEKMGSANDWLVSDAFDLKMPGISPEAEIVLNRASIALRTEDFDLAEARNIDMEMSRCINPSDPTWTRWRMLGKQKGWWV